MMSTRLGLIAPAGLWLDDHPIPDLFATMPYEYPALLFHDVEAGAALMTAGVAFDDPEWLKGFLVTNARQLGMAGKILFPIPERGLVEPPLSHQREDASRLGRQRQADLPHLRAKRSRKAIKGAELVAIPEAGHMVTIEKPDQVLAALGRLG